MQEMPGIRMAFVGIKRDKDIADLWAYLKQFGADGFGESFLAPGDVGRFIGWGVVETLEGAALATIDAVERWADLDFASCPMSWQGEHNRLNTCSPAAASCPNVGPVEAATAIPAISHVLSICSPPLNGIACRRRECSGQPCLRLKLELQRQQQP